MSKEQILNDYIELKRTSIKYEGKIKDITKYTTEFLNSSDKPFSKFTQKDLISFINKYSNHYSPSTMNTIKPLLKHIVKWYFVDYSTRFRQLDQLCQTKKTESTYKAEDMLSEKEVVKLANGETDLMWKVWFLLLFYGAFRPSELARLTFGNIKHEKDGSIIIKVFLNKNKKYVYKSIPEPVAVVFRKWEKETPNGKDNFVFPSRQKQGQHINSKTGYMRIVKLSKKALGKHVNPYRIRHSFGSIKYNDDNIPDKTNVAEQMGHTKDMLYVYKHLDEGKLVTNAKKIWAKPDDLPKEVKHKLEREVEELKKHNKEMAQHLADLANTVLEIGDLKGRVKVVPGEIGMMEMVRLGDIKDNKDNIATLKILRSLNKKDNQNE